MSTQGFVASHAASAAFERGLRSSFEYRDLGIKAATEGQVVAHVIRAAAGKEFKSLGSAAAGRAWRRDRRLLLCWCWAHWGSQTSAMPKSQPASRAQRGSGSSPRTRAEVAKLGWSMDSTLLKALPQYSIALPLAYDC